MAADDEILFTRLKTLSRQLDAAKKSVETTAKEVARAKATAEKTKKAVRPHGSTHGRHAAKKKKR